VISRAHHCALIKETNEVRKLFPGHWIFHVYLLTPSSIDTDSSQKTARTDKDRRVEEQQNRKLTHAFSEARKCNFEVWTSADAANIIFRSPFYAEAFEPGTPPYLLGSLKGYIIEGKYPSLGQV
jgi:hypothetical protein